MFLFGYSKKEIEAILSIKVLLDESDISIHKLDEIVRSHLGLSESSLSADKMVLEGIKIKELTDKQLIHVINGKKLTAREYDAFLTEKIKRLGGATCD